MSDKMLSLFEDGPEDKKLPIPTKDQQKEIIVAVEDKQQQYFDGMHPTALVFLDDPLARKMAVAWTACRGDESKWLLAAGLSETSYDAKRLGQALRMNGICRENGTTDPLALRYITQIAAAPLLKDKAKEKK